MASQDKWKKINPRIEVFFQIGGIDRGQVLQPPVYVRNGSDEVAYVTLVASGVETIIPKNPGSQQVTLLPGETKGLTVSSIYNASLFIRTDTRCASRNIDPH